MVKEDCTPPEGEFHNIRMKDIFAAGRTFSASNPETMRANVVGKNIDVILDEVEEATALEMQATMNAARRRVTSVGFNWIQSKVFPMGELLSRAEAALGIPIYRHFRAIEDALTDLDVNVRPWREEIYADRKSVV